MNITFEERQLTPPYTAFSSTLSGPVSAPETMSSMPIMESMFWYW